MSRSPGPSAEFALYRRLSREGVAAPARITATDLRRDLREVLARVEYADLRVAVTRQGRPVAALLPMAHLERLETFERTGIRHAREHLALVAEFRALQGRLGRDGEPEGGAGG